jgi:hypothetical protein
VSGAGLQQAVELARPVGVLTAADSVKRVRQSPKPGLAAVVSDPGFAYAGTAGMVASRDGDR